MVVWWSYFSGESTDGSARDAEFDSQELVVAFRFPSFRFLIICLITSNLSLFAANIIWLVDNLFHKITGG